MTLYDRTNILLLKRISAVVGLVSKKEMRLLANSNDITSQHTPECISKLHNSGRYMRQFFDKTYLIDQNS